MKRMWVDVGCQMRATSSEMRSTPRAFALFTVCFGAPGGVSALRRYKLSLHCLMHAQCFHGARDMNFMYLLAIAYNMQYSINYSASIISTPFYDVCGSAPEHFYLFIYWQLF